MKVTRRNVVTRFLPIFCALALLLGSVQSAEAASLYVDRKADVVFVIDGTGSMGTYIASVKENLTEFINLLSEEGVNVRVRFVTYRDITCNEETKLSGWYTNVDSAITYLNGIQAMGGGDGPETVVDGIGQMFQNDFAFREDACPFSVVLTDADYKMDNTFGYSSVSEVVTQLRGNGINTSVVTNTSYFDLYRDFVTPAATVSGEDGGILADILGDYSILLKTLADTVIEAVQSVIVTGMTPTSGVVGEGTLVKVSAKNIVYGDDFQVTVGGEVAEVTHEGTNYFRFRVPTILPVGSHEVIITNSGGMQTIAGEFTCEEKVAPAVTAIAPVSGEEGIETTVKVTTSGLDEFELKVTVGGEEAKVTYQGDNYFKFKTPTTLVAGSYDIIVEDEVYGARTIEQFTYTAKPVPVPPAVTEITPLSGEEGEATVVKVATAGLGDVALKVTVGGVEAKVIYQGDNYVKFRTPTTLAEGSYDIVLEDDVYGERIIGQYTYIRKAYPEAPEVTGITPASGVEGTAVAVKVVTSGLKDVNLKVYVGGVEVKITYQGSSYIKIKTPSNLAAGSYDIVLEDDVYGARTIGQFVYAKKPEVVAPDVTAFSVTSGTVGKAIAVKATVSGLKDVDLKVYIGGVEATVTYQGSNYVKYKTPTSLSAGTYDIVFEDEVYGSRVVGQYTYK